MLGPVEMIESSILIVSSCSKVKFLTLAPTKFETSLLFVYSSSEPKANVLTLAPTLG